MERGFCLETIRKSLSEQLPYTSDHVESDFEFIDPVGKLQRADIVAFSETLRKDVATSCIAVVWRSTMDERSHWLPHYKTLAAPYIFVATPDIVEIWRVSDPLLAEADEKLPYSDLDGYFSINRLNYMPSQILAAKRGKQLSLFDGDESLLGYAEEVTRKALSNRLATAVQAANQFLSTASSNGMDFGDLLTKVTLYVLAALVLRDKTILVPAPSGTQLLAQAAEVFPGYFRLQDELSVTGLDSTIAQGVVELVFEELSGGVTFRSVSGELLGHLYENVMVSPDFRRLHGIHYTPRALAEAIIERIPFEEIPSHNRLVADGSCGSGSLLVAAYERLERLMTLEPDKHGLLRRSIFGVDQDRFAREFARLSLLLRSLGDSWNIKSADFLKEDASALFSIRPSIIVGNPPFVHKHKGPGEQVAARFIDEYLKWLQPKGLMGIVLPQSYLTSSVSRQSRRKLLKETEVLEIWKLPRKLVIPSSWSDLAVLIVRKKGISDQMVNRSLTRVIDVTSKKAAVDEFFRSRVGTNTYVISAEDGLVSSGDVISPSPLNSVWRRIKHYPRLAEIVELHNGIIPGNARNEDLSREKLGQDYHPWLGGASWIHPYQLVWDEQEFKYVRYPGSLHRPRRDASPFYAHKVVINANSTPSTPHRLFGAIDRIGVFPSNGVHCLVPRHKGIPLELIAAVINHPIANEWISSHSSQRYITSDVALSIPIPHLDMVDVDKLVELVRRVETVRSDKDELCYPEIHREINQLLYIGYDCSSSEIQLIEQILTRNETSDGLLRKAHEATMDTRRHSAPNQRWWWVTGQVRQVESTADQVELIVDEINGGRPFTTKIPRSMPGWALVSGVMFEARLPYNLLEPGDLLHNLPLTDFHHSEVPSHEEYLSLIENFFTSHPPRLGGDVQ